MNYMQLLEQIFQVAILPLLGTVTLYMISLIKVKKEEVKAATKSDIAKKYLDMLNSTITSCVLATNQTYVNSLKEQGKFDLEAQKTAFKRTYDTVVGILTDEAKVYLSESVKDLEKYITSKIEFEVALDKM